MNRQSRIRASLTVATATCFAALAVLVPGAPGAPAASDPGECRLPAWIHAWTGHWGGDDCR
jgi:hypothetical protein